MRGVGVVNEWRKQVQWTTKAVSRMSTENLPSLKLDMDSHFIILNFRGQEKIFKSHEYS